jgi:hypothetical protein
MPVASGRAAQRRDRARSPRAGARQQQIARLTDPLPPGASTSRNNQTKSHSGSRCNRAVSGIACATLSISSDDDKLLRRVPVLMLAGLCGVHM